MFSSGFMQKMRKKPTIPFLHLIIKHWSNLKINCSMVYICSRVCAGADERKNVWIKFAKIEKNRFGLGQYVYQERFMVNLDKNRKRERREWECELFRFLVKFSKWKWNFLKGNARKTLFSKAQTKLSFPFRWLISWSSNSAVPF